MAKDIGIDKYNAEGYCDHTTYEAITNIQREEKAANKMAAYLPLVYGICLQSVCRRHQE